MNQRKNNLTYYLITLLCLTFLSQENEIFAHSDDSPIKCGFVQAIKSPLRIQDRPALPFSYRTASGKFLIHYDTSGVNAVPRGDENHNGIPDYVDSAAWFCDFCYEQEISIIGYKSPPFEDTTSAYHLYLIDLHTDGYYGRTTPTYLSLGSGGTDGRFTSYMEIDNDFSPNDSSFGRRSYFSTGYDALKITIAHEFHHVVQLGSYGKSPESVQINELTSTWMEYRVFPDTRDYEQFLPGLFHNLGKYPLGDGVNYQAGYHNAIFGQYLFAQFGDSALKRTWEIVGTAKSSYVALNSALSERGTSLADEWCGYSDWLYYTGLRSIFGKYFAHAVRYPMLTFLDSAYFSEPSLSKSGTFLPLEAEFFRYILPAHGKTPDTLDIFLGNNNAGATFGGTMSKSPYSISIQSSAFEGAQQLAGTNYWLKIGNSDGFICHKLYLNNGFITKKGSCSFPNPFHPTTDLTCYLQVPDNAEITAVLNLTVFNSAMEVVYSAQKSIVIVNSFRAIEWDGRKNNGEPAQSGIYIFSVENNGQTNICKMALVRE